MYLFDDHNLVGPTPSLMRDAIVVALILNVGLISCTYDHDVAVVTSATGEPVGRQQPDEPHHLEHPAVALSVDQGFDVIQRACALYVAVRSGAWEDPAFGRDTDDTMVRWNLCPGGTMVACAPLPGANGDTTRTGIPWPYHLGPSL